MFKTVEQIFVETAIFFLNWVESSTEQHLFKIIIEIFCKIMNVFVTFEISLTLNFWTVV